MLQPARKFLPGTQLNLRRLCLTACVALLALALPAAASATTRGAERITYKFGPVDIKPGQNTISFEPTGGFPRVPGYITRFKPNLIRVADGKVPRVDVMHLHHAVWLVNLQPQFAAGEEKTTVDLPSGYGWRSLPSDRWIMNHMIHNLYPQPDRVYITYTIDFVPDTSPVAKRMKTVRTQWMDVQAVKAYPVFDVPKGGGRAGKYTYPNDDPNAYAGEAPRNRWVVDRDAVLVATAAHLHPGGLYGDLWIERGGRKVRLFRSRAKYFEPAGAVSWDVSMEATPKDWRVAVKKGDVVTVTGTYDSGRAAWYESMAIMPLAVQDGGRGGLDPFRDHARVDVRGKVTHGHLAENRNHGGRPWVLPDATSLADGPVTDGGTVDVTGFVYGQGDLAAGRPELRNPPVVSAGQSLTYFNADAPRRIEHTITACKAPCNRTTGIAYPLADAEIQFDSGQLGFGPAGATAAANRDTWQTPTDLPAGTYSYFCRVHPYMRGAFRVK
jgi:plastocyanin